MNLKQVLASMAVLSLAFCSTAGFATPANTDSGNLEWKVLNEWQLPESPIDVVYSLDGKYVFMLTDQHKVLIYTSKGKFEGSLPVDKGVSAIDIAPRGEALYLVDSEKKSFSTLSIDFVKDINIAGSPFRGLANAPVILTVFTDFE